MLAMVCALLVPITFLMGRAALKILYRAGNRDFLFWEDEVLTGAVLLIGLAEAAHLGAMARGRSVSVAVKLFVLLIAGTVLVCTAVLTVCHIQGRKTGGGKTPGDRKTGENGAAATGEAKKGAGGGKSAAVIERTAETAALVCLGILAAVLAYKVLAGVFVYADEDLTLETVITFLETDRIYEVNPLTGLLYREGLPSRLKILCLPTLYSVLCRLSSASAQLIVWKMVPLLVLLGACLAYSCLAKSLFPKSRLHRELFLAFVLLLFLVGDGMYGMEGFGLFYAGFQGVSIRGAVLLPYLLSLCIRKKWRLTPGPVLAEACMVWTLYGLGAGAAILGIFGMTEAFCKMRAGRKEVSEWENS